MALTYWSQDKFSQGELSPLMYSRITVSSYYDALKTAKNVFTLPQGAATKRFGTIFQAPILVEEDYRNVFFKTWTYLDECTYIVVARPTSFDIYLEGTLQSSILTTIQADEIQTFDYTTLDDRFRIGTAFRRPFDLVRQSATPIPITGFTASTFTFGVASFVPFTVNPLRFTATTLPTTTPQVRVDKTYFSRDLTASEIAIYATSPDAKADRNRFAIANAGTAANVVLRNAFTVNDVLFSNTPVFDFGAVNYETDVFTLTAATGTITLGSTDGSFLPQHVGGSFEGNGGKGRIITFTSANSVQLYVVKNFDNSTNIIGADALLTEPAWSDLRGWPKKCSSYQSRSVFANSESLPNGIWLSVINDFADFNSLDVDDDDSIAWYPSSDNVNVINFIVPYRSLTVHSNSGVFSTPVSQDVAITPKNFSMTLQDSTPATRVQPRTIDNQIIVISGSDAHALMVDNASDNSYTVAMISVVNEQVLNNPIDEAEFRDLNQAGSRYMLVVNEDGTLAIYQTLITEQISGWTRAVLEQSYGKAFFRAVTSDFSGRCWFLVERELAAATAPIALTASTSDTLTAVGSNFSLTDATAFKFEVAGTLPTTTPQVVSGVYYWAIGVDANSFKLYPTQDNAEDDVKRFIVADFGTGSSIEPWPLKSSLDMEELKIQGVIDGGGLYSGVPTSTLTVLPRFNAQKIKINGDGFGFDAEGIDDTIKIEAHGVPVEVSEAEYGFPIEMIIEPLPLSIAVGQSIQTSNLAKPKHIRNASFMVNDTIGGTVNGVPIAVNKFNQVGFGVPPVPMQGFFEFSVMKGWNDFDNPTFTIVHNEPFNFRLLGIYYTLEV